MSIFFAKFVCAPLVSFIAPRVDSIINKVLMSCLGEVSCDSFYDLINREQISTFVGFTAILTTLKVVDTPETTMRPQKPAGFEEINVDHGNLPPIRRRLLSQIRQGNSVKANAGEANNMVLKKKFF